MLVVSAGLVCVVLLIHPRRAPASVEEQRARLPPPARACPDPVEGEWLGHELLRNRWYRFTLHIRREAPGSEALTGTITSHSWDGDRQQTEPPDCAEQPHNQYIGDMPAEGSFRDNVIAFTGQRWELREVLCGRSGVYYPDAFSGPLERDGAEFQTVNDDGHNPIVPVVFRRIRCGPDVRRPMPELPPADAPPKYARGCGGCF